MAGAASPSTDQWYTAVDVTSAIVFAFTQRQNTTFSDIACDFIFVASSMLKICSCVPARSAITFATGFMIAASALIWRRVRPSAVGLAMSTMTTWPPPVTAMNLSDSMEHDPNLICSAGIPSVVLSCAAEGRAGG